MRGTFGEQPWETTTASGVTLGSTSVPSFGAACHNFLHFLRCILLCTLLIFDLDTYLHFLLLKCQFSSITGFENEGDNELVANVASGEAGTDFRRSTSGGAAEAVHYHHQASPGNGSTRRSAPSAVQRPPPRRSSSGSLASTVAAKRRQSKTVEVIGPHGVPLGSPASPGM